MGILPKMTLQTRVVLQVFADAPGAKHYGLEICRAAGLAGGTIYPLLARLEDAGWLTSDWEDIDPVKAGRRPRRYYQLTDKGAERARQTLDQARPSRPRSFAPGPVTGRTS